MKNLLGWVSKRGARKEGHVPVWQKVQSGPLEGVEFFLPKSGKGWAGAIVKGGYEPAMLNELTELAREGGTLYDIGGHIGYFACAWMKLGGGGVECFEPVPGNAQAISDTLQRNGFTSWRVHRIALGDYSGECTLMLNAEHLGKTSMAYVREAGGIDAQAEGRVYKQAEPVSAQMRRLDEFAVEAKLAPPRAIKLDVEGAEYNVLLGARDLLERHHPTLLAEIHNVDAGILCTQLLSETGYRATILDKANGMPVCRWDANR